jgi:hypothetical protein
MYDVKEDETKYVYEVQESACISKHGRSCKYK